MKILLSFCLTFFSIQLNGQESFTLFLEEFNDNSNYWRVGNRPKANAQIKDGVFYFESKRYGNPYARRIDRGYLRANQDYEISIRMKQVKGDGNRAYALEWGGNSPQNSFFEFWVRKDGYFTIDFFNGDTQEIHDFIGFTPSQAINTEGYNVLKVRKENGRMNFFINEIEVYQMESRPLLGSEVGFRAPSLGAVEVDYLKIDLLNSPPQPVFDRQSIPQIHVVIVGITDYSKNESFGNLEFTVNDALSMADFYQSRNGGSVDEGSIVLLLNEDASRENIISKTESLFQKANPKDMIVFYFSGHGDLYSEDDKELQLITYGNENSGILISEVEKLFSRSIADKKLLLIDACHSGGTLPYLKGRLTNHLATLSNKDVAILTSSDIQEKSIEHGFLGENGRGIFSYYLTNALNYHSEECDTNDDGIINILELFEYVRDGVHKEAKETYHHVQNPQIGGRFNIQLPIAQITLK